MDIKENLEQAIRENTEAVNNLVELVEGVLDQIKFNQAIQQADDELTH